MTFTLEPSVKLKKNQKLRDENENFKMNLLALGPVFSMYPSLRKFRVSLGIS